MRTSVDSETRAPSWGSVCRRSVTAGANVQTGSSSRPSSVGARSARTAVTVFGAGPAARPECAAAPSVGGDWSVSAAQRTIITARPPSQRTLGVEHLKPPLHFGQAGESPGGFVAEQRQRRPNHAVGVAGALGGIAQDLQRSERRQAPPSACRL